MPERVAIVGSREFEPLDLVGQYVQTLPLGTIVVSGGAPGVDRAAEDAAKRLGYKRQIYAAEWWTHGRFDRSAGMRRNARIVEASDRVVAFWDGVSRGTMNTVEIAREAGKPVMIGVWDPQTSRIVWGV